MKKYNKTATLLASTLFTYSVKAATAIEYALLNAGSPSTIDPANN